MNIDEYEREGREKYASFSAAVAAIISAAIGASHAYRLQQVANRAKQATSLRKKLSDRKVQTSNSIENEIKDLAGCRVIFYTNNDVSQFINSGLMHQNFEVLEVKLHHPQRASDAAAELYISNHFVVSLQTDRLALPEYAHFAGMRCEVQIQTILNHAWAEMAHDTIYKEPALGNFGGKALEAIKGRMAKVSRKYLVPAGYEFQKIAYDFQRLVKGKELLDGDALAAIVAAPDNNVRAEALETFVESVLPFYDDAHAIYPKIVEQLLLAADRSRREHPIPIETPYGALRAKTYGDIAKAIIGVLRQYRYVDVDLTFRALCQLHDWVEGEEDRNALIELAKALSKYNLDVWRQYGPVVQAGLVELIGAMSETDRSTHALILIPILEQVLSTELSSTTSSSDAMTIHRGAVGVSKQLLAVRAGAIDLLIQQFAFAESEPQRRAVLMTLQNSASYPIGSSPEIAKMLADDRCIVLNFMTSIASTLSLHARQDVEDWVLRCYWNAAVPAIEDVGHSLLDALASVRSAALMFRDEVNSNEDFVTYKLLVGLNPVYFPAWESKDFHYENSEVYRNDRVAALLASISPENADQWFERVSRYAKSDSNDLATFATFGCFLTDLAMTQPAIVLEFIERMEPPLMSFLPVMLDGLMQSSEHEQTRARIISWIDEGEHLHNIICHIQFSGAFDEGMLVRAFERASELKDMRSVRNALFAAVNQFRDSSHALIERVFIPALVLLTESRDPGWARIQMYSWLKRSIIGALDETEAKTVLDCLVSQ
jgi:ppGpp synthetase/RelA/SpoT-type nucleotidyltranferase